MPSQFCRVVLSTEWPGQSAHAYVCDRVPPTSMRGIGSATATISFASHSVECQVDDHQKIGAVFPFPPSTRPTLKYSLHSTSPRLEPRAGREEADRVHPQFHDSFILFHHQNNEYNIWGSTNPLHLLRFREQLQNPPAAGLAWH